MSKVVTAIAGFVVMLVLAIPAGAAGTYNGGDGSAEHPYEIDNATQLISLSQHSEDWDKCFILTDDIDMGPNVTGIPPFTTALIAPDTDLNSNYFQGTPFTGIFNGNGFVISNITIHTTGADSDYLGFFGNIDDPNAIVKNLGIKNIFITGGDDSDYIGGLAGSNSSMITQCYTTGMIFGNGVLGGLCGMNELGRISNCYSSVYLTGLGSYSSSIGGLVGASYGSGDAAASYLVNNDQIEISNNINETDFIELGSITNCYSIGSVDGNDVGGLLGNGGGFIYNCFWDIQTSGVTTSDGGQGLNTEQMQNKITYYGWGICGNDGIWTIDEGHDYPHLFWENKTGASITNPAVSEILDGSGEPNNPYLIYNTQQLVFMSFYTCEYDKHYKLMDDIDLSLFEYALFHQALIAPDYRLPFAGCFDGNGHVICNLTIDTAGNETYNLGLFGNIDSSGVIKNVNIVNVIIDGGESSVMLGGLAGMNLGSIENSYASGNITAGNYSMYLGVLVGYNAGNIRNSHSTGNVSAHVYFGGLVGSNSGNISNCYSNGIITTNGNEVGGLAGENRGTVRNCHSTMNITSGGTFSYRIGGLVGHNHYGSIYDCYSTGNIKAYGTYGSHSNGGLVGYNYYSNISNCYCMGDVFGDHCIGGLVGRNEQSSIHTCFSTGKVTGGDILGGLIGYDYESSGTNYLACFWNSEVNSGLTGVGNITDPAEVMGKTTNQMKIQTTYTDYNWEFPGVWHMPYAGAGYPMLWWQRDIAGDIAGRYGVDLEDAAVVAEWWGQSGCGACGGADIDGSGAVDIVDLAELAGNWLKS